MTATRQDIEGWIKRGQDGGATHVIIACDTYDWDNYPVYVMPGEDVREKAAKYQGVNMQQVDEVYSLTGKYTVESQLAEHRARHYD